MMGVLAMGLFGCSETNQYSPEQVINNALEEAPSLGAYYAESEMITYENGKETKQEQMLMKEWRSKDGKSRVEIESKEDGIEKSIAVNDGSTLVSYQINQNQAFLIDDPELLDFNQPSPKEQAMSLLEMIRETHAISTEGEEKVAGRVAYHLVAKAKEEHTLFGDQELWIDKENWFVLKMILHAGDNRTETTYTTIDFDVTIPPEKFVLDLPDDIKLQNIEDMNKTKEITLEEVAENIGQPVLYFPEDEGIEITTIEMFELQGELDRTEISFDYRKDTLPLLTMAVFESPVESVEDLKLPGEEPTTIRNQEGMYMESMGIRSLSWQEKGLTYSIMLIDPNLTVADVVELAEHMVMMEQ